MSIKIAGKGGDRQEFFRELTKVSNLTLAGYPTQVALLSGRSLINVGETTVQRAYGDTIFCPCIRGDQSPQKRIFDSILNGCIPVVLSYNSSNEESLSFYAKHGDTIRQTYPFAEGNFDKWPNMGIDWRDLVVSVDGSCGPKCILPTLEKLLSNHWDMLVYKQHTLAKYAKLFSVGMETNGLQHVDAVSALLVHARHYINSQDDTGRN